MVDSSDTDHSINTFFIDQKEYYTRSMFSEFQDIQVDKLLDMINSMANKSCSIHHWYHSNVVV